MFRRFIDYTNSLRAYQDLVFVTLLVMMVLAFWPAAAKAQTNTSGTVLPSAAYITTTNSNDFTNTTNRGGHFIINVSQYVSGNWTPKVQGRNPITGAYYDLLTGSAISSTGVTVLKVYPGLTAATNVANDIVPRTWRISMVGAATPVSTFSVSFSLNQ